MYSTVADLLKLLSESDLLGLAGDSSTLPIDDPAVVAVLEEAIGHADSEIDTYVGTVRSIPLSPVPTIITRISSKLAVHNLYLRRPTVDEPEDWRRETARCQRLLEGIAAGRIAIGAADGVTAQPDSSETLVSTADRIFTPSKWEKF